jgi:NAD(P)-dependent dehydrogenase (short-subunit alcohol dehydrogenase family)
MKDTVCLVTGANTGIGFEIARGLLSEGRTVVLGCRDLKKGEAARATLVAETGNPNAVLMQVDLANLARLRNFVTKFEAKYQRLDVLVHNAGVWPRTRRRTEDGFELTFGVNHLGPFFLTHLLRPLLEKSAPARVVVLTSSLHFDATLDFEDPMFKVRKHHGGTAYGQSKLANVLFTLGLARRLVGTRVTVNAVHPGVVATELSREAPDAVRAQKGKLTPKQGAVGPLHLASSAALADVTGAYFEGTEQKAPSRTALDVATQDRLWAMSLALLKLPAEG